MSDPHFMRYALPKQDKGPLSLAPRYVTSVENSPYAPHPYGTWGLGVVQITSAIRGRGGLSLPQSRACGVYAPRVAMATAMAQTVAHTVPRAIEYDTGACRA